VAHAFSHSNVVGYPTMQVHQHINGIWFMWWTRLINNATSRDK